MRTRFFPSVLFFFFCLNALSYAQIAEVGDLNGAFIPQSAVEALDEGILHGLTRRNVVPCDAALIGPCQDGVAGEFACR